MSLPCIICFCPSNLIKPLYPQHTYRCEEDVQQATFNAAEALKVAGATVTKVSIPLHADSAAIWLPLCLEGGHATRIQGGGKYYRRLRAHKPKVQSLHASLDEVCGLLYVRCWSSS